MLEEIIEEATEDHESEQLQPDTPPKNQSDVLSRHDDDDEAPDQMEVIANKIIGTKTDDMHKLEDQVAKNMERLSAKRAKEESDTAPIQESSHEDKRKQHEDLLK